MGRIVGPRDESYAEIWYEGLRGSGSANGGPSASSLGIENASALPQVTGLAVELGIRSIIASWAPVANTTIFYEVQAATTATFEDAESYIVGSNRLEFLEGTPLVGYYIRVRARLGTLQGPFSSVVNTIPGRVATDDMNLGTVTVPSFLTTSTPILCVRSVPTTILTVNITTHGNKVLVRGFFESEVGVGQALGLTVIQRDGVTIYTATNTIGGLLRATIIDTPSAGAHTYTIVLTAAASLLFNPSVYTRTLVSLELRA